MEIVTPFITGWKGDEFVGDLAFQHAATSAEFPNVRSPCLIQIRSENSNRVLKSWGPKQRFFARIFWEETIEGGPKLFP